MEKSALKLMISGGIPIQIQTLEIQFIIYQQFIFFIIGNHQKKMQLFRFVSV